MNIVHYQKMLNLILQISKEKFDFRVYKETAISKDNTTRILYVP